MSRNRDPDDRQAIKSLHRKGQPAPRPKANAGLPDQSRWEPGTSEALILKAIPHAVIGVQRQTIIFANESVKTVFGWTPEELAGKSMRVLFKTDDECEKMSNPGHPADQVRSYGEMLCVHKDGRDIVCRASIALDESAAKNQAVVVLEDITEQKRLWETARVIEEKYRASQIHLSEAMDLAHIVYWELDPASETFIFNDPFYAFYCTTAEREGGYRMARDEYGTRFVHPEDMEFFILAGEKRRLRKESEFSYNVEHRITRRDGEVRHIIARIRVSKDPEGRITKCYGANQDITEMKKAHQDLQEAYKRLQEVKAQLLHSEKLAVVGQLATGIAHEIKNPLAIILQGADYLHSSLATPQPHLLQVVQMIKEASVRADNTIKELLGFSKQTQTAREERHIVPVIEESLHLVEHQLGLKNVRIIRSFADGLPLVKIDRNQFKQALMNIIMNGVDAIAPLGHGFITISCETIRRERCVRVTIADTGAGIPADVLPRIFDPFFTTKRKEKNVGLGLTITQHIIEQHDGTMKIESDATGGTRVIIDLPAMND